ncbi:hypothetical protein [Actinomadura sp. B10D3]|uniref:hypothetical protein n=1 Tax=Actinomadura sp. B10D3 TaxID=3153557 RepID=UPI00325F62AF
MNDSIVIVVRERGTRSTEFVMVGEQSVMTATAVSARVDDIDSGVHGAVPFG